MQQPNVLQKLSYKSVRFIKKNSPTILTCVGAAGVVGTAIFTAKATTKAAALLEAAEEEKGDELTKLEKLDIALPVYIPTILVGAATITCIFGANMLNQRHQASLVSAYGLLDRSYKEYKEKVKELYGDDAEVNIREKLARDNYTDVDIPVTEGKELYYDDFSKRYFEAKPSTVQHAKYNLNRNLVMRDYAYLNEWYEDLGLPPVDGGDDLGWTMGQCMDMYWQAWVDFGHSKTTMDDGRECNVIHMFMEPILDFENYI